MTDKPCSGLVNGVCIHGFPATLACSETLDFYYRKYVVRIPRCMDEKWAARFLKETGTPSEQQIAYARAAAGIDNECHGDGEATP